MLLAVCLLAAAATVPPALTSMVPVPPTDPHIGLTGRFTTLDGGAAFDNAGSSVELTVQGPGLVQFVLRRQRGVEAPNRWVLPYSEWAEPSLLGGAETVALGASLLKCAPTTFKNDTDYHSGKGLGHAPGNSPMDCCQQCSNATWQAKGCRYFTFSPPSRGDACWFKASDAGKRAFPGAISGDVWGSGPPPPPPPPPANQDSFYVLVDGVVVASFDTTSATMTCNITVPSEPVSLPAGTHSVRLFKTTEADWNQQPTTPSAVVLDEVLTDATLLPLPVPATDHRIEFVGDSITAGFCNMLGNNTAPFTPVQGGESYYFSWANQVCQGLNATCHAIVKSGFGMVRNLLPGPAMPELWRRTLASNPIDDWDFSSWVPNAVVINLGTNDHGHPGDQPYTDTYYEFGLNVTRRYGKNVSLFLACGPMTTSYCPVMSNLTAKFTANGFKAYFVELKSDKKAGTGGCCSHPCARAERGLAATVTAVIKKSMGW